VVGYTPTAKDRTLLGEFLYNMGGSIIRISRPDRSGRFAVASDPKNRRIHTLSGLELTVSVLMLIKPSHHGVTKLPKGDQNYLTLQPKCLTLVQMD